MKHQRKKHLLHTAALKSINSMSEIYNYVKIFDRFFYLCFVKHFTTLCYAETYYYINICFVGSLTNYK